MKNEYDIIIVGAGPAGSIAAKYAAEHNVSVLVLEKDRDIGYPVRCGEAINKEGLEEFIKPDNKFIAATINTFRLISPDGTEVKLKFNRTGYILNRKIFDLALAEEAAKRGAEFLTRAYVNNVLYKDGKICGVQYENDGEQKKVYAKIIIAADGVESRIARMAGINTFTKFQDMECCVQMTAGNVTGIDENSCYFYFGNDYAPGGYVWVFPKGNNSANIGLGIGGDKAKIKSPIKYFNYFKEKHYPKATQLAFISGGVPCAITHKEIVRDNFMIIGDAAQQVNPLSGGGIASGMIAGSIAGNYAGLAIKNKNIKLLENYSTDWYKRIGKKHESYYRIKNGIYKFTDKDLNRIAHSAIKLSDDERTLRNIFKIALFDNPILLLDIVKLFI